MSIIRMPYLITPLPPPSFLSELSWQTQLVDPAGQAWACQLSTDRKEGGERLATGLPTENVARYIMS